MPKNKNKRKFEDMGPVSAPNPVKAPDSDDSDDENDSSGPQQPVIVLLDQARLETVKTKRGDFEIVNCDDHRDLLRKNKKDYKEFRPDISHQELLALIDSPLNKAGKLKVYMRTHKNVLIDINPQIRFPRTFKRFSGLMVQLLHKMKIKAAGTDTTLLKVIKNPFHNHLPAGTRVYGMSRTGTLYKPDALAARLYGDETKSEASGALPPVCFIIGAMASGHITVEEHPYIEEMFSISEYPLSGACAIARILGAVESQMGII